MKTNQIMIRPMGQFKVEQRTRDGFFNATELLRQWNEALNTNFTIEEFVNSHVPIAVKSRMVDSLMEKYIFLLLLNHNSDSMSQIMI